jgi:hypothetical protein
MRIVEARYGRLHNISMAIVAVGMIVVASTQFARGQAPGMLFNVNDPRFVLYLMLFAAMAFYVWTGINRFANRAPQVVISPDGIQLGFGRDRRLAWKDIEWVRLHRVGLRPALLVCLAPEAYAAADLRLSMWSLDDGLRPIRGVPSAVAIRDNGLDTRAAAMLDAVKSFRPNLVRS